MPIDSGALMERYNRLCSARGTWLSHWDEVAAYCAPRRIGFTGASSPGDKRTLRLYNPIGVLCVQTLASALHGMVMNPATLWMSLRMADDALNEREDVREWLDDVSKRILAALQSPSAAFHVHVNQVLEDLASFGTGPMYIGVQKSGSLYVRSYSVAHCLVAENQYGVVDTVMREANVTVRQAVQQFGRKVSRRTFEKYANGEYDKEVKIVHAVMPRADRDRDPEKYDQANMPIASCYFEPDEKHLIEEGGVEEMPYVVPRWAVATGEEYGRSPAMTALPAVKVANSAQKMMIDAAELAIRPPLVVPHEGVVSPVRATPGGLTYVRNRQEIGQLPTSSALPFSAEWLQALNNEIRSMMLVDQLQFVTDARMTATEVMQRTLERMRLLGPVLGRLENELLNPLVTRAFGILNRLGMIPEPPQDIQGRDMRVEYLSPLARSQKQQLADGFIRAMAVLEPLAQIKPEQVLGPIDFSRVTPHVFDWFGVDPDLLKDEETLAADARQEQMRMVMQALPDIGRAVAGGGRGVESLASAARQTAEAAQLGQQMQPPAAIPPGVDLQSIINSGVRGAQQVLPRVINSNR